VLEIQSNVEGKGQNRKTAREERRGKVGLEKPDYPKLKKSEIEK
jgi:hypothetical protein